MDRPRSRRRMMAQAVSRMGMMRARIGTASAYTTAPFATDSTEMAARVKPRKWLPASPMNTRAGCRLKSRKPTQAPIRAPARITMSHFCKVMAATRMVPATIATTPAARPSTPSRKVDDPETRQRDEPDGEDRVERQDEEQRHAHLQPQLGQRPQPAQVVED